MKEKTLIKIKIAVNSLIKNEIKLSVRTLSIEAKTSKDNVLEFFKLYPKESFNKYYKTGALNTVPVLNSVPVSTVPVLNSVPDSNAVPVSTVPVLNSVPDSNVPELNSVPDSGVPVIATPEGFIYQLNKLLKTGIINKSYYKNQITFSKKNYPESFQFLYE